MDKTKQPYETKHLRLDITKAKRKLSWKPKWNIDIALNKIVDWIEVYQKRQDIRQLCIEQIKDFMKG